MTAPQTLPENANMTGEDESFSSANKSSTADALPNARTAQPQSRGPLLDEKDEKKVCQTIVKWVRDQSKARKRRRIVATRNRMWLKGVRGIQIRPINEDITDLELYRSPANLGLSTIMARAGQLIERVVAHLLSDEPAPEAEPEDDSDVAREAADVASRVLTIEGGESGFNTGSLLRRATRKGAIWGSAFLYPCVDPHGGGWRPMEIEALLTAQTVDEATLDPQTGIALGKGDPRLTTRYVRPDKSLTDDPNEADRQWIPKIRVELLTPDNVVLLPEVCQGVGDALGAILIQYPTISELRAKFKDFASLDDATVRALMGWRPEDSRGGTPFDSAADRLKSGNSTTGSGELDDQSRLCTLSLYFKSHGAYPKGAYIVITGDRLLHRQEWCGLVEKSDTDPETDDYSSTDSAVVGSIGSSGGAAASSGAAAAPALIEECCDIPLAQIRQLDDDVDDDPFGHGLVDELGEIDEQRAYILNAWNDYLDKLLHLITFIPMGSNLQPGVLTAARVNGDAVYYNPQGKPEQEQMDPFPPDGKEFFDRTTEAGNSAVGLEQTAQGTEVSSVTSGAQAAVVVQQAAQNMSAIKHNMADGTERFWRVVLQLFRIYFTIPMQAKYLGEDGGWRLTEWTRADFRNTRIVKIKSGTFTQLTAEQKEAKADKQLQMQVISGDQYRDIVSSGIRPVLGIKEDPHIIRVRRQISLWDDGPPQGWQPPQAPMVAGPMGQPMPQIDPMSGQPVPPPPDPLNPFADKRSIDQDPNVARKRFIELSKHQAEARYIRKPPQWRVYFDQALDESRRACGAYTLAEQQAAQAQQQQQQVQQTQRQHANAMQSQQASQQHEEKKLAIAGDQKAAQAQAQAANEARNRAMELVSGGSAPGPQPTPAAPTAA